MKKAKAQAKAKAAPKAAAPAAPATKSGTIDNPLVRQLAEILNETGLTEIEYDTGALRVRVARQGHAIVAAAPAMTMAAPPAGAAPAAAAGSPAAANDPAKHPGAVKAPMVGVAYLSPEPGAAAFIKVGDRVSEGQTLLLIEAMKTFNPVKAPKGGTVTQILVENSAPVEYGEPLVIIE